MNQQAAFDKTIRLLCYAAFACYTLIQIQRLWRRGADATLRDVITAAAKITFATLLIITFWFQPWYVIWLLPLAALADEPFVRRQGMFFALGALMTYAVSNFLFVQDNDFARGLFVQFFEIIVAFGPLLLIRGMPEEQGWSAIARQYLRSATQWLNGRPVFWDPRDAGAGHAGGRAVAPRAARRQPLLHHPARLHHHQHSQTARRRPAPASLGPPGPQRPIRGGAEPPDRHLRRHTLRGAAAVAIIGSLTVLAIYLLTLEILRQGSMAGRHTIALLAALLVATSAWHVSLSRSGMEVVTLPLLMCLALYWLLRALRVSPASQAASVAERSEAAHRGRGSPARSTAIDVTRAFPHVTLWPRGGVLGLRGDQFAEVVGAGICTGLACDLAPGLWLVPLTIVAFLLLWLWRRPTGLSVTWRAVAVLTVASVVSGAPALWHFASGFVGFPEGNAFLAQTSVATRPGPTPFSLAFWGQVLHNAGATFNLLRSQDFSAGYPSTGGTAIIPALLLPFAVVGLYTIIRWRGYVSLAMLALIALPLIASVAVGTATSVIDAASVLPALCIVPAIGIYTCGEWVGNALIVLDRTNGARVFSTPEHIGRIVLLIFLMASTVRTFFWYFEATLPTPNQQWTPSMAPSHVALASPLQPTSSRQVLIKGLSATEVVTFWRAD